jgi:hypothetical protein
MRTIAALYVQRDGCYYGLDGVDPWDEERDALRYRGPHPVVAHPPCERWGRYWFGGPSVRVRKVKGDDGGCFAAALASVQAWGGVLEHPAASAAWSAHGLRAPIRRGGWSVADDVGGWTCHVEQGHYGHRARKATWLYAVRCVLPSLRWGPSAATVRIDEGYHSAEERRRKRGDRSTNDAIERMGARERAATPPEFRDMLIAMAMSVPEHRHDPHDDIGPHN